MSEVSLVLKAETEEISLVLKAEGDVVEAPEGRAFTIEETEVHVLAVDDSLIDRKVIEKVLKSSAYKVTTVDSGRRALEILGVPDSGGEANPASCTSSHAEELNIFNHEFNLIITDYCMPGMSGYDLLKKVKETTFLKEIPVVVMSSENVPKRISRCLEEGAMAFLLKPVQLADVQRLRGHLRPLEGGKLKRKTPSEGFEVQKLERRPCLSSVTVS